MSGDDQGELPSPLAPPRDCKQLLFAEEFEKLPVVLSDLPRHAYDGRPVTKPDHLEGPSLVEALNFVEMSMLDLIRHDRVNFDREPASWAQALPVEAPRVLYQLHS